MTIASRPRAHQIASARTRPFLFVDVLAPALVVFYLVVAFEPFWTLVSIPGAASSVLLPVAAVGILALTPRSRLAGAVVSLPLIAIALWTAMSRLWTVSPGDTDYAIRSSLPALVLTALVAATIRPARLVRTLLVASVAIVGWSLLYSLAVPAGRMAIIADDEQQLGFRGSFIHKNHLGIFAVFCLALVLPLVAGRLRWPLLALCVGVIVGTRSATAASGLFIVAFIWISTRAIGRQRGSRERMLLFAAATISAVVGVLVALRLLPTLLGLYSKDLTFSGRTTIWAESLRLVADRPLTGFGLGSLFPPDPPSQTFELWRRIGFEAAHAHNGVIGLALDTGWIGVALVGAFLVQVMATAARARRHAKLVDHERALILTLWALLLMSVSEPLFAPTYLGYLALVWVVAAQPLRASESRERRR